MASHENKRRIDMNQNHSMINQGWRKNISMVRSGSFSPIQTCRKSIISETPKSHVATHFQRFQNSLIPWKELIVHVDCLLRFEDPQGFCLVFFSVTTFILIGRYFNPSAITTISLILLFCTLFEMTAPSLVKRFFSESEWLPMHETRFHTVCEILFDLKHQITQAYKFILKMKKEQPMVFLCTFVPFLTFVTLFGWKANNWTCAYVVVVAIFVLPGMFYHGLFGRLGIQFLKVLQVNFGITPRRK